MTIEYRDLVDGVAKKGRWKGRKAVAVATAIEWFGARYDPELEVWVYHAPEAGEDIAVDEDELAVAGAAILAGARDWESLWCADYGTPLRELEKQVQLKGDHYDH